MKLLLKLPKPYSYNFNQVFYNAFSNSWEYLPKDIDEEEIVDADIVNDPAIVNIVEGFKK